MLVCFEERQGAPDPVQPQCLLKPDLMKTRPHVLPLRQEQPELQPATKITQPTRPALVQARSLIDVPTRHQPVQSLR